MGKRVANASVGIMMVLLGENSVHVLGSCRTIVIYVFDRHQAL